MKLQGISNKGFSRIAKSIKAQTKDDQTSFPGMEDVRHPPENRPIPLEVEKAVYNTETGAGFDYDEFVRGAVDMDELVGEPQMSKEELIEYVSMEYDVVLDSIEDLEKADLDDVVEAIRDLDLGDRGNTYNWSWWGPTLEFITLGEYEGVLILSEHLGGDVRGNYAHWKPYRCSFEESAPWSTCHLAFYIKTDQGEISLDAEDYEAYSFIVNRDETGMWESGESVDFEEIKEKLNWEESDLLDLWQ